MDLTNNNYYSTEANTAYWSVSQFKSFDKCEAAGLAECHGLYERPETDALLIGSYVDAYFSNDGEFQEFQERRGSQMFKRNGQMLAKYEHANTMINALEDQPACMEFMQGERQSIMAADLFGVEWKIKMDFYNEKRIVDLKTVKDFEDIYEPGYGWRDWISFWKYDIQGAIYTRIEQKVSGRDEPLPFYIVAVTKEKVPDVKIIHIPDEYLQTALQYVESKIGRFQLIKQGDVEPIRCEHCDYCKETKIITAIEEYEIRDDEVNH